MKYAVSELFKVLRMSYQLRDSTLNASGVTALEAMTSLQWTLSEVVLFLVCVWGQELLNFFCLCGLKPKVWELRCMLSMSGCTSLHLKCVHTAFML